MPKKWRFVLVVFIAALLIHPWPALPAATAEENARGSAEPAANGSENFVADEPEGGEPESLLADEPEGDEPAASAREETVAAVQQSADSKLAGLNMKLLLENEALLFYMNETTYEFAVAAKESGDVWFSNPPDREQDAIATGISKELLEAQLSVSYYNRQVQEGTMNSYTDSVALGQAKLESDGETVKVTYQLGKEVQGYMIPAVIAAERMDAFLSEMGKDERDMVLSLYKMDNDKGVYALRTASAVFKQKEAETYFKAAGYTLEDYYNDNEANNVEGGEPAVFKIPVEYRLEQSQLIASIPGDEVEYKEDFPLTQIRLLPYFGAGGLGDEGYLFVPDGSGALIRLNNHKTDATTYVANVFGNDETLNISSEAQQDKHLSVKLPIFGLKKNDGAFLAIMDGGEAYGSIVADISGKTNAYNTVFAQFNYLPNGKSSLDNMTGSGVLQLYQREPYQGSFTVRYGFLSGDAADYSGMANYYRNDLIQRGLLNQWSEEGDLPFYLGLIGSVNLPKKFMGIPYEGTEVLTSYDEAREIIDSLKADGINRMKVKYSGWFNGGLNHSFPEKAKPVSALGGKKGLKAFASDLEADNIPAYFDVDFGYVYRDKAFDGFNADKQGAKYLDNSLALIRSFSISSGSLGSYKKNRTTKYILNASYLMPAVERFAESVAGMDIKRLSLRSITSSVASNLSRGSQVGRQESLAYTVDAMKKLKDNELTLMGSNTASYAFPYTSDILESPMDSNRYLIIDETIPFYQMVLHGYIDYSGKALNLTDDYMHDLLKSVETGAGLYVEWIYADNSILKETRYDYLYSVNYEAWYDEAVSLYQRINSELRSVQGKTMTSHRKVLEDVYETTYDNGTAVYVNYSDRDAAYNGLLIGANDFAVREG